MPRGSLTPAQRAAHLEKMKKRNTEGSPERADYLNSTGGLVNETIKGLPAAAGQVGSAIVQGVSDFAQGKASYQKQAPAGYTYLRGRLVPWENDPRLNKASPTPMGARAPHARVM